MEKRFLFPLIGVGTLSAIAAIGFAIGNNDINRCNSGDDTVCQELIKLHGLDYTFADQITNPAYTNKIAELQAVKDAAAAKLAENKAKAERDRQEREAALAKKRQEEEAKFKAEGWWEQQPGIFVRWCDGDDKPCPGSRGNGYSDYTWRAMVWCKERACGDIYARLNISQSGTVVGWTNDSAYGGYGQKVVLTFGSSTRGSGQIVEFSARG